jgi:iron(III) transport system substrate-binding protein
VGAGGQTEWDQVVAAAKQEGVVAVAGPSQPQVRDLLTGPFTQQFGIEVEYLGHQGRDFAPRIQQERQANQFLWDIYFGGTTTGLTSLIPAGALDPLEPALILPDVKDPKSYRGGAIELVDPGRTLMVMTPMQRGTIYVNHSLVDPAQFTSYRVLLDPKWRGKIIADDPRGAGPGQATFSFFYLHPELGPSFIRELARQEITFLRDFRQELDAIGHGRYEVLLGAADATALETIAQGVPITIVPATQLKEGTDISPAEGAVALVNRAPHPNAARVYLNWVLSKEAQTAYAKTSGFVSSRLDVPTDHTYPWRVPHPNAIKTYDLNAIAVRDQLLPLLEELFGKL